MSNERKILILRLDHRAHRDQRITSHVALSARTFGATGIIYSGERDENLEESIKDVTTRWGGSFTIEYRETTSSTIRNWKGIVVHLTMYGESHLKTIGTLEHFPDEDILLIIGGAKVPRYVYSLSDFNTAVGWQPHSEISAMITFLYDLDRDNAQKNMYLQHDDASVTINPEGKKAQRSARFRDI